MNNRFILVPSASFQKEANLKKDQQKNYKNVQKIIPIKKPPVK